MKRLTKSNDAQLEGVCGGIAEYIGIDPVFVRLAFVIGALAGGAFVLAYLILMFVMPEA
jgi:phage shock protein C